MRQWLKFKQAAGKTAKSIMITVGARLARFDIEEVCEVMEEDELNLDELGEEYTALFIITYMIREKDFSYNLFKVDPSDPYKGLFAREPKCFRYTINHSKKEYFDVENTALRYTDRDGKLTTRINPLPLLMAYSDNHVDDGCGIWIGDSIEVSNDVPVADYKDMSGIYRFD